MLRRTCFPLRLALLLISCLAPIVARAASISSYLFWDHATGSATSEIRRSSLDGSGIETLLTTSRIEFITVDPVSQKLYWTDSTSVRRANFDGSEAETVVSVNGGRSLAVDAVGGKVYWAEGPFGQPVEFRRANLDGTGSELLLTGEPFHVNPTDIALDSAADRMYWLDSGAEIYRSRLNGSDASQIMEGSGITLGMALDATAGHLYWINAVGNYVNRMNVDGTGQVQIAEILTGYGLRDIALDLVNGRMYLAFQHTGNIQRANLDGSMVEDVVTGQSLLGSMALFVPEPTMRTLMGVLAAALFVVRFRPRHPLGGRLRSL